MAGRQLSYGEKVALEYAKRGAARRAKAKPKKKKELPKNPPMLNEYPLHGYKYKGTQDRIDWSSEATTSVADHLATMLARDFPKMTMLVAPPGLGKTGMAVSTIAREQERLGHPLTFIVVAPRAVVEGGGWQETICAYNNAHPDNRLDPLAITTYEKLANVTEDPRSKPKLLRSLDADAVLVIDECHAYKNPTSKRSKQLQKLGRYRRLALTATPLTNDIIFDSASYLIMAGYYRNKTNFMDTEKLVPYLDSYNTLSLVYDDDGNVDTDIWPGYRGMLDKLSTVIYQPDVTVPDDEMPDVTATIVQLPQSDSLDADMRSLARANRKRMFNSPLELMTAMCERIVADEPRLDRLVELCRGDGVVQPLVFFWHRETLRVMGERLDSEGIRYQVLDGEHHMADVDKTLDAPILVQYAAGAEGVEFKMSNTTVFYENQFSYVKLKQARGRNVRRGGDHPVRQYYLIAQDMFDQQLYSKVANKEELNDRTLGELAEESLPSVSKDEVMMTS